MTQSASLTRATNMRVVRYVIKTKSGYISHHLRGRVTKYLESARTFKTYRGAESNKFCSDSKMIARVEIEINELT